MQKTKDTKGNLRFSIRLYGSVTSVYVKRSVLGLYILICKPDDILVRDFIQEGIQESLDTFKGDTGKGLSEHVTTYLLSCVSGEYLEEYNEIMEGL